MPINHQFVSPIIDEGDPNVVGPNEWNDIHSIPDHNELGDLTVGDDHSQYLLLAGRAPQQAIVGNVSLAGWMRVGSNTAPANVTAGDVTLGRLSVGNTSFATQQVIQVDSTLDSTAGNVNAVLFVHSVAPPSNSSALFRTWRISARPATDVGIFVAELSAAVFDISWATAASSGTYQSINGLRLDPAVLIAGNLSANVTTLRGLFMSGFFNAAPTSTTLNVGTYEFISLSGGSSAGLTVGTWRYLNISNPPADHTITTLIGIDLAAMTRGSTNNFSIRNAGNSVQTGYARFGAVTAPTNVTAGDLTAVRVFVGNNAAAQNSILQVVNDSVPPAANQFMVNFDLTTRPDGTNANARGAMRANVLVIPTGNETGASRGFSFAVLHNTGAFNVGTLLGINVLMQQAVAATTATTVLGINMDYQVSAGTVTLLQGIVSNLIGTGATAITTMKHLKISVSNHPTAGTSQTGIEINNLGNAAWATSVAIDQLTQTGSTAAIGLRNATTSVFTPSTAQVLAAATAIQANATVVMISSAGNVTVTAAPTIADGQDGQILIIINVDSADTITLQDQGTLAASNLRLAAGTIDLAPRNSVKLMYSATVGDWVQIGPVVAVL